MGTLEIRDDAVWVTHIEGDPALRARILSLEPQETIDLEVDGVVGKWEKMKTGKDGRPTSGIRPIGSMKAVWKHLRKKAGAHVEVREVVSADTYLASVASTLSEWDSPEDVLAYSGL